jgi:hypothetical protein
MAINVQRTTGRSAPYKFDRGGMPTDFGPFIGEIVNNVDSTRSGRVQVYVEQFGGGDKTDKTLWRTVSYIPPFGGATPKTSTSAGVGTYGSTNNQQSYGMSFSPPDIGVQVLCFFVAGDPNQGFYIGVVPPQGINHMVPAIGAAPEAVTQNENQATYFANSHNYQLLKLIMRNKTQQLMKTHNFLISKNQFTATWLVYYFKQVRLTIQFVDQ